MIRMRTIMFFISLMVVVAMVLIPEFSSRTMTVEGFGWHLQVRQGFFVILLLLGLWLVYTVHAIFRLLLAGHGRLRLGWRSGRLGRKERVLRDGLMKWVDAEGDLGQRALHKSHDVIPDWLRSSLQRVCVAPADLTLPLDDVDEALGNAIAARLVTEPRHRTVFDGNTRRMHLRAWLQASPGSLLAQTRLAQLELEEGNWLQAAELLESLQKKHLPLIDVLANSGDQLDVVHMLAEAWLGLAEQEEQAKSRLRKIRNLKLRDGAIVVRLGQMMLPGEGTRVVKKLWLDFLQQHDDEKVAQACFELLAPEALPHFREIEHIRSTPAFQWMKARLAHACELEGLADEIMNRLLSEHPRPSFLRTRAQWLQDRTQWQNACTVWQQAMDTAGL